MDLENTTEESMWLLEMGKVLGGIIWRPLFEEFHYKICKAGKKPENTPIAMEDVSVVGF